MNRFSEKGGAATPESIRPVRDAIRNSPEWEQERKELAALIRRMRFLEESVDPESLESSDTYVPPTELLRNFYEHAAERLREIPMTKEEIERFFSSEYLSKLSLSEYTELLKRVPPRFMTHVTRQGIRDHISHHDEGRGQMHRGFENILEAGQLNSVLEQELLGEITHQSVERAVRRLGIPEQYPTRVAAKQRIYEYLETNRHTSNLAPSEVADARSLHVALDMVADTFYGGEEGNEIFFVYPAAYIAARCYVGTQVWNIPEQLKVPVGDSNKNDFWLLMKERKVGQLPVEASLVFLPKNASVDAETGSRYLLDKEGIPIQNTEQLDALLAFVKTEQGKEVLQQLFDAVGRASEIEQENKILHGMRHRLSNSDIQARQEALDTLHSEANASIERSLNALTSAGITEGRIKDICDKRQYFKLGKILDWTRIMQWPSAMDFEVENALQNNPLAYTLTDRPVSSEKFWKQKFEQTGRRPSKIVWYDTMQTPTEALDAFKKAHQLTEHRRPAREIDLREMFRENLIGSFGIHDVLQRERELFAEYSEDILNGIYS